MDELYAASTEDLERLARRYEADAKRSSRIASELLIRGVDRADVARVQENAQLSWQALELIQAELNRRRDLA